MAKKFITTNPQLGDINHLLDSSLVNTNNSVKPAEPEKPLIEVVEKEEAKAVAEVEKNEVVKVTRSAADQKSHRQNFKRLIYERPIEYNTSTKTMSMVIPDEVGRKLKMLSTYSGMNMKYVVTNLVKEFLNEYAEEIELLRKKAEAENDIFGDNAD